MNRKIMFIAVVAFLLSAFCAYVYLSLSDLHSASPIPYPLLDISISGVVAGLVLFIPLLLYGALPALFGFSWVFLIVFYSGVHVNAQKKNMRT